MISKNYVQKIPYTLEWSPICPSTQVVLKNFIYFFEKDHHACLKHFLHSRTNADQALNKMNPDQA